MDEKAQAIVKALGSSKRPIDRSTFVYLEPKDDNPKFAQCETCFLWISGTKRCVIHSQDTEVQPTASCYFYVPGEPQGSGPAMGLVTPEESGLEDRPVRCENCKYFTDKGCELYYQLNEALPDVFKLDTKVKPQACCNANTPKEGE